MKNKHIQKTCIILKPDAVQRTLVGEIIQRFEKVGLKITALKMIKAKEATIEKHYTVDPHWKRKVGEKKIAVSMRDSNEAITQKPEEIGEQVLAKIKRYMTAGPIIVAVLEGSYAVPLVRKLVGGTEPLSSDVGTIRGDYVLDSYQVSDNQNRCIRNLIHASSGVEEAEQEINVWFNANEFLDYKTGNEYMLCDINFDNEKE